jgi:hypothetical protein
LPTTWWRSSGSLPSSPFPSWRPPCSSSSRKPAWGWSVDHITKSPLALPNSLAKLASWRSSGTPVLLICRALPVHPSPASAQVPSWGADCGVWCGGDVTTIAGMGTDWVSAIYFSYSSNITRDLGKSTCMTSWQPRGALICSSVTHVANQLAFNFLLSLYNFSRHTEKCIQKSYA